MREIEKFRRFTSCLKIAHHIPGRIRLKLDLLQFMKLEAVATEDAKLFQHALDNIPGIHSISMNLLAFSCVIEYNTQVIPQDAWHDLLNGAKTTAADTLIDILERKYTELRTA